MPTTESFQTINRTIAVLYRYNQALMAKLLEPIGIGQGQYPYIIRVCKAPGITQDRLSAQLLLNKSSVARVTAQLEEGGFLYRETDPADKRSNRLYPTEKGRDALTHIQTQLAVASASMTRGLTAAETGQLAQLLRRMADNIDGWADGDAPPPHKPGPSKEPNPIRETQKKEGQL